MKLDDEFHRTLAEAAGKPYAWHVIEGMKTQMDRVRFLSFNHFRVERLIEQHTQVVQAIAAGNSVEGIETMRVHLRGILDSIHQIAGDYPAYFNGAYSGPIWPPILEQSGHCLWFYLISDSGFKWSLRLAGQNH